MTKPCHARYIIVHRQKPIHILHAGLEPRRTLEALRSVSAQGLCVKAQVDATHQWQLGPVHTAFESHIRPCHALPPLRKPLFLVLLHYARLFPPPTRPRSKRQQCGRSRKHARFRPESLLDQRNNANHGQGLITASASYASPPTAALRKQRPAAVRPAACRGQSLPEPNAKPCAE